MTNPQHPRKSPATRHKAGIARRTTFILSFVHPAHERFRKVPEFAPLID